ncbi:hypothetical protein GUITHDRAFT_121552 [Guillardia theta CCMP2712]|uniref:CAAX prenyl protease 2/Lysostaphin resistance protein A-like domain-containing protein n=1 Tax=Guillardia theta (strain CCMP2712) TaxID=905079 RepID=L1I8Y7_GUITC|nr:hypothetical protein GUITHDRAFT_121552 [Guillardia theta CCMP2712]EKX32290.1 hypothetical protein GUITHDRAFT_121552 [Guillardia theta CCMP2712]|eukprot:XP_005819270.1 hypothetical protein GUITHDRAFT_121552 [Guillardia theta CCMP2712]
MFTIDIDCLCPTSTSISGLHAPSVARSLHPGHHHPDRLQSHFLRCGAQRSKPLTTTSSGAAGEGEFGMSKADQAGRELEEGSRPEWLPAFVPLWVTKKLHPLVQFAIMLACYAFHLLYLSKNSWNFPEQLIPNSKGAFQSIGLDSIAGLVVVAGVLVCRKLAGVSVIPPLLQSSNPPWRIPREAKKILGGTTAYLLLAYIASGYGAVLLGHLMWVYMGIRILGTKHKPFFPPQGTWLRWRTNSNWVWWVVGSYFVSALLFNIADLINQFILPSTIFDEESVVSKLVNPENKDLLAMAIGAVGPCISAPIFEEVLYRGFLLPALAAMMPLQWAIPTSSILFAVHHLNIGGILPLSVLGLAWAIIYTQSRNLLVTILIHALWNSRVFLGSFNSLWYHYPLSAMVPRISSISHVAIANRKFSIRLHDWPDLWIRKKRCWNDMDEDTRRQWKTLGWDEKNWKTGTGVQTREKRWDELNCSELKAAKALGYDRKLWETEDQTIRADHIPRIPVRPWEYTAW